VSRNVKTWFVVLLVSLCHMIALASEPISSAGMEAAIALYRNGRADEATVAFDNLVRQFPADDSLKVWKTLAMLEKAIQMKEEKVPGYKALAVRSYAILKPLTYKMADNPDWYYAMAEAFWLNDRPMKAEKAIKKALYFRQDFPEAYMLLGDMAYDDGLNAPPALLTGPPINPMEEWAIKASAQYERVLNMQPLGPELGAEACFKMGMVELALRGKKESARIWWRKALNLAPQSRYGKLAQEKVD